MRAFSRVALAATLGAGLLAADTASAQTAPTCQRFGGFSTGAWEGFASFMAEAAMKNAAKAKFGDNVKIGAVSKKCSQPGVLWECHAAARACK